MPEISDAELKALKDAAKAGEKAQALYDALLPKFQAAEAQLAKLPELEKAVESYKARELDQTYASAGITDAKVRRIFELEYQDLTAPEGKEKPALGDWLSGLRSQADLPAHLKPFLAPAPAGAPAPAAPRAPAGLPDPNKGVKDLTAAKPQFTAEDIDRMSPAEFRAAAPAIAASNPALAGLTNHPLLTPQK